MDPPTPWITWAVTQWNAALNQNLLHPATAPAAIDIERRVIDWLSPAMGMTGGHVTPGASIANLTALWAARDGAGIQRVLASDAAHLSIAKSARILGLDFQTVETDREGRLLADALPTQMHDACLVLTAGTTATGIIDPLAAGQSAGWRHVDAAWAGALRFSPRYADLLDGITQADSVALSAHKCLFQPKESAMVFFRDTAAANAAISFDGAYLAQPNIGVLGSHGATAAPLLATLLAWGRDGLAKRIDRCMQNAKALQDWLSAQSQVQCLGEAQTGVVVWRLEDDARTRALSGMLPVGSTSLTQLNGGTWLRNVCANPMADVPALCQAIGKALDRLPQ